MNFEGQSIKSTYRQKLSLDPSKLIRPFTKLTKNFEKVCMFFIIFFSILVGIIIGPTAIIIMNAKEFLKASLFGFLTELNLLPLIIQYQSGFVCTKSQLEQFKRSQEAYFSVQAVYQRNMDEKGQQKIQQIQQLFQLNDDPLERSKQLQKESGFLNQLNESVTFNILNQMFENIRIIFKSMPLLIIKYINVITLDQWDGPYQKFSIIISIISISWSSFWFIIDIFENNIDPVLLIHNLRDERKLQFEEQNVDELLPLNIKKEIKVDLSVGAGIPDINFIAYSKKFYFKTIDKFTFYTTYKTVERNQRTEHRGKTYPIKNFTKGSLMLYRCLGNIGENINFGLKYLKKQFYYYDRFESRTFFKYLLDYLVEFYICKTLHITIDTNFIEFRKIIPIIQTIQALDFKILLFQEDLIDSLYNFENLTSLKLNLENLSVSPQTLSLLGRHEKLRILSLNLNSCFQRKTIDFFKFIKNLKELTQLELQLRNLKIKNLDGLIQDIRLSDSLQFERMGHIISYQQQYQRIVQDQLHQD